MATGLYTPLPTPIDNYADLNFMVETDDPDVAFGDAGVALLVGAMPRKAGMERSDLLSANGGIFKPQGKALSDSAKKDALTVFSAPVINR